jgi:fatty acid desaturase
MQEERIPAALNMAVLAMAATASALCLYAAAHAGSLWAAAGAVILFSFTANTLFALLHESVHGILLPGQRWNNLAGCLPAAFFPTGLSLQRAYHLTHHQNNRTQLERFDYVQKGDILWLKYAQWYCILTGLYWAFTVLGTLLYLVIPQSLRLAFLRNGDSGLAIQTASGAYLSALDGIPPVRARVEILLSFGLQALMFWGFDLTWQSWLACYAAFALNWSALQYADHAFSKLDTVEGAWNLKVNPVVRTFFLNYHYHLVHHRHPQLPWLHLPSRLNPSDPMPAYREIWLQMWRGPRPLPSDAP